MLLSFELMMIGIITLIFVAINLFVAIKILAKYFEVRDKTFLYAGLAIIGIPLPWTGVVLNFISIIFFDTIPPMELHFFIHGFYIAFATFFWLMVNINFSKISETKRKKVIIIAFIITIIVESVYLTVLFTDTTILGTLINEIQVDYAIFSEIYLLTATIVNFSLALWLGSQLRKSENEKVRLQGKLIITGYCIFVFAGFLEVLVPIISVIIFARILVIFMAITFYGTFVLPKWMERLFLKQKDHDVLEIKEEYEESKEVKDDAEEFFKVLSQRRDITEKEVSFYRERNICLVCKGKVGKDNAHTCTECDALYCERCSLALAQLENSCWACNEAIDKSKPIRVIESEEERIEIITKSEEARKKNLNYIVK